MAMDSITAITQVHHCFGVFALSSTFHPSSQIIAILFCFSIGPSLYFGWFFLFPSIVGADCLYLAWYWWHLIMAIIK